MLTIYVKLLHEIENICDSILSNVWLELGMVLEKRHIDKYADFWDLI